MEKIKRSLKNMIENLKKIIKRDKFVFLILIIGYIAIVYTSLHTFSANDDLPYSFLYRGNKRIETLGEVILNERAEYQNINGRFFIHCVVSTLLIFERTLWAFLNPIVLMGTIYLGYLIITHFIGEERIKKYGSWIVMAMVGLLLSIYSMKELVYWIAGSINYVWTFFLTLFVIFYYLKTRMKKHYVFNSILFLTLAIIHECTLAFSIVFLLSIILVDYIKDKKIDWKKFLYFIPIILGACFLLMAPGNSNRMEDYPEWYAMSFIERMQTSIPGLSKLLLNYQSIYNIIPLLFTVILIIRILKEKNNYAYILSGLLIITLVACFSFQNGWLCFFTVLLLFAGENYLNVKQGRWELSAISLSIYAVVFSVSITPLYYSTRPNYFLYVYYIILTMLYGVEMLADNKKIASTVFKTVCTLFFVITIAIEVYAYTYIGTIQQKRMEAIEKAKQENQTEVYMPNIKEKMKVFQIDSNIVLEDSYWASRYYRNLYGIPQDITIIPYDEK